MRRPLAAFLFLASCLPAAAMVGGGGAPEGAARGTVMIVGSRGNSCSGALIARDLILTAAHCVLPGADYKLVEFDAQHQPALRDIARVESHPQFSLQTLLAHRATADVALLKLATPTKTPPSPVRLDLSGVAPGDRFTIAGYGVSERGNGRSGGTLRTAALVATGKPGNLQIRLIDPATRGERAGLGACTGDSGGPAFAETNGALAVIGVVSWSTGPNLTDGCGGLTGITPLTLYRGWIADTAKRLGSPIAP